MSIKLREMAKRKPRSRAAKQAAQAVQAVQHPVDPFRENLKLEVSVWQNVVLVMVPCLRDHETAVLVCCLLNQAGRQAGSRPNML